jgi:hypothetical protein
MLDDPGQESEIEPLRKGGGITFQAIFETGEIHGPLDWFPAFVTAYTRTDAGGDVCVRARIKISWNWSFP